MEFLRSSIARGELKRDTDPDLLIDALYGPLFYRWLQGHAPVDRKFVEALVDKIIPAFVA
jgi:Tetracyclin repressor-like, C-terminal domain